MIMIRLCVVVVVSLSAAVIAADRIDRINEACKCGGNYIATGAVRMDYPIRYEHVCNGTCRGTNWLQVQYPFVRFSFTDAASGKMVTNAYFWVSNNVASATNFSRIPRSIAAGAASER